MNKAHSDAIELLKIVDGICRKEGLLYTLAGDTLITYAKMEFDQCYPAISIAMEYDSLKTVKRKLNEFCREHSGYSCHDYSNTRQFFTSDVWFVKESRVRLGEDRAEEAFYYGTHLSITPLYYAGNSQREWEETRRYFDQNILPVYFRKMLKKKPVFTYLAMTPRRIRTNRYLKHRDFDRFGEYMAKLENREKSEYLFFSGITAKYSGINLTPAVFPRKIRNISKRSFWENVERVPFVGIECYCIKDRDRLLRLYSAEQIKHALMPIKSEVLLAGGEELRRVQLIQLELLEEFDRICRKHNLKYNLNFGTLIGALRHKGFIPWDDDIDVTMYYKDCDRLYEIMKQELNEETYFYRCPETEKNHHLIFHHLEHRGTTFTKPGRDKLQHKIGVFIDIFPMYPAAPNAVLDFFHTRICRFWRTALWSTVGADSEKKKLKRWYYRQLAKMGNETCRRNFLKWAEIPDNKDGRLKFWTSEDRSPYNVDLVRKDNFDEAIEVTFEGRKFFAPKHWEGTLEFCFSADWRLYPDVSNRLPHHDATVELGDLYSFDEREKK